MNRPWKRFVTVFCGVALLQVAMFRAGDGEEPKDRTPLLNLQQITLAIHEFHASHESFPAHANYENGKAMLSWRVHILPFLGEKELYAKFRLNEAWDSPHNKQLIANMPKAYASQVQADKSGNTRFLAPLGPDHIFTGKPEGVRAGDIADSVSKTVLLVEVPAGRAVVWTKPDDLTIDPKKPETGLIEEGQSQFTLIFADGVARRLPKTTTSKELQAMFTRSGSD